MYKDFGAIGFDLWQVLYATLIPKEYLYLMSLLFQIQNVFNQHQHLTLASNTYLLIRDVCYVLQVKSGTIFDNVLITDDEAYAEEFGNDTWGKIKDGEKKMKDEQDEEERKQREEEDAKRKEEEGGM